MTIAARAIEITHADAVLIYGYDAEARRFNLVEANGIDKSADGAHVTIDQKLFRPAEVEILLGDSSLARQTLGWSYGLSFLDLVHEMVDEDLAIHAARQPRVGTTGQTG